MNYLAKERFLELAKVGMLAPVYAEMPLGEENPFSLYLKVKEGDKSFLLESGRVDGKLGCYSFIGSNPLVTVRSKGDKTDIWRRNGSAEVRLGKPLNILRDVMSEFPGIKLPELPLCYGGAVGLCSYDLGRYFEKLPVDAKDDLEIPELYFMIADQIIIVDKAKDKIYLTANVLVGEEKEKAYEAGVAMIEALAERLAKPLDFEPFVIPENPVLADLEMKSNFSKEEYEAAIRKVIEYIKAGDVFQVNISQRVGTKISCEPLRIYEVLRQINPSPFGGFFEFGEMQLVSCSPERLIRLEDGEVSTRPIAGTRPRGKDQEEDLALEQELVNNKKERAEHIMLVDLERNDLGRVCKYGTVRVDELMVIERYSHVMHIVSNVIGKINNGKDAYDLVKACFPGGTITGAPKVRCMEIIEELEPVRRGPYTGSFGYFNFAGDMDLNITIRTIVVKDGMAYAQAGGGIVYDSIPEREYYETLYKAEAMLKSIRIVEGSQK